MGTEIDRGKRHDITAIDQGLIYLARSYGKARKASRLMKEDGLTPIPASTLDNWKRIAHPARYEQLRAEWEKRRDLDAAERMGALVSRALDIEEDLLEKTAEKADKIDPRDLANAFKNLAIGSGVLQDKSDRLKGKPAHVIEHRHDLYPAIERAIAELEREVMEAETVDAEVVEEPAGAADKEQESSPVASTTRLDSSMADSQGQPMPSPRPVDARPASSSSTDSDQARSAYLRPDQADAIDAARERGEERERQGLGLPDYL